jgi:hypothetical protein
LGGEAPNLPKKRFKESIKSTRIHLQHEEKKGKLKP